MYKAMKIFYVNFSRKSKCICGVYYGVGTRTGTGTGTGTEISHITAFCHSI